jgi:hypothetical protein
MNNKNNNNNYDYDYDNDNLSEENYYNKNDLVDVDKSFFIQKEQEEVDYTDIEVDIITAFSSELESVPSEEQSIDFQQIVQYVKDFLKKKCKHTIVLDSIDINPERSQTIVYCTKCGSTISGYPEKTSDIFWKNN